MLLCLILFDTNVMATDAIHDVGAPSLTSLPAAVNSELLCFIVDRSQIMTVDDLVKICSDFYTEEETVAARDVINSLLSKSDGPRLPKRTRVDKARATVEDIVKAILSPHVQLPQFYAVNLSRLPPVTPTHCDMSLLLGEIQSLCSEVQAINHLRAEFDSIREEVELLSNFKNDVQSLHGQIQQQPTMLSEIESVRSKVQSVSHLGAEFNTTQEQVKLLSNLMTSSKSVD